MPTMDLRIGEVYTETLPWDQSKEYDLMEYRGMTCGKGGVGMYLFEGLNGTRCFTEFEIRRGYVKE